MKTKIPAFWLGSLLALATASGQVLSPKPPPSSTEKPLVLSIFEVSADKEEGYRSSHTTSSFNSLTTLRNTPGSISVMNRELMDDLNVADVAELSKYAITGEVGTTTEGSTGTMSGGGSHIFRGLTSNIALRNGVSWQTPVDAYALERVELLRGPSAFLYGEGAPGGMLNSVTKLPVFSQDFQRLNLSVGSWDYYRAELDVNRRLNDKFAIRMAGAFHEQRSFVNHADRRFKAIYLSTHYRPFEHTNIKANVEWSKNLSTGIGSILSDGYTTTDRTGATTALTATTGGFTYVPATGQFYDSTGLRLSSGTNIILPRVAPNVMPSKMNLSGPGAAADVIAKSIALDVAQQVGENLSLKFDAVLRDGIRYARNRLGNISGSVRRDVNPTLPSGTPNPYFNQLYTEYQFFDGLVTEPRVNFRAIAVYDLKLPFTTQRVMIMGGHNSTNPVPRAEVPAIPFVDPAGPYFKGRLTNANTQAAVVANNLVLSQNHFRRRFYLVDGDKASILANDIVPNLEKRFADGNQFGSAGRRINSLFRILSYGAGVSGSYLNERLHTMGGWRIDGVDQTAVQDFNNVVTGQFFRDLSVAPIPTNVSRFNQNKQSSINYGAVVSPFPFVSAYYNYAQSVAITSGIGAGTLFDNTLRGVPTGDGNEVGLRWSFFGGRLESNWTSYRTNMLKTSVTAALDARTELYGIFPSANLNGSDTQATKSSGLEFETVANLTKNWRLIWNYANNKLALSQRYPVTKEFRDAAKAKGVATPLTDAFLLTQPDGVPVTGFTKVRSNLVTNYRFDQGALKNVSIGGAVQYREESYLGNFDLNLNAADGAEQVFSPGYFLASFSLGYRTTLWNRKADFGFMLTNAFDKVYYRAFALGAGNWGEPRAFRISMRMDL